MDTIIDINAAFVQGNVLFNLQPDLVPAQSGSDTIQNENPA